MYCRPYKGGKQGNYEYYVDSGSSKHVEMGTVEYPYKNLEPPSKEILNFMYEIDTNYTVYIKRGTVYKLYYGLMPIVIVNIGWYNMTTYGDSSLPNPYVYIVGHEYLWPDSTMYLLAETYYDFATRVARKDMDESEATKFFLKFNIFRGSQAILNIDF